MVTDKSVSKAEAALPEKDICPQCGLAFKSVISHWIRSSKCSYPNYPGPLMDITRGLLSVVGGFANRDDCRNYIEIGTRHENKAVHLRNIYGMYGMKVNVKKYSGGNIDLFGYNTDVKDSENYKIRLSPNPALQSYRDIDFENAGEFAAKAVLYMRAVKKDSSDGYNIYLPLKRSHRFETVFSEYYNKNRHVGPAGTNRVTYTVEAEVVEKYDKLGWPTGWWNERYME